MTTRTQLPINQPADAGPVARVGQLVRASYDDDKPVLLSSTDADRAIDKLEAQASTIEATIQEAILRSINGSRCEKPTPAADFKQAGRSYALGPIFDFSDIRLFIEGFSLIACCCVTVCIAPKTLPLGSDRSLSKFWLRLRVESGPKGGTALSREEMRRLSEIAREVSAAAFESMRRPYAKIISDTAGKPVEIALQETISVFMTNASDGASFDKLFLDAGKDGGIAKLATRSNKAASSLLDAASAVLPIKQGCSKPSSVARELKRLDGDVDYLNFEDMDGYRSVIVANWLDAEASLVGIARGPDIERADDPTGETNNGDQSTESPENPANRVSAAVIAEIASRF